MTTSPFEFRKLQKVKERIREIMTELELLDGRRSPQEYNLRAKLAVEMRQLQEQITKTKVKLV